MSARCLSLIKDRKAIQGITQKSVSLMAQIKAMMKQTTHLQDGLLYSENLPYRYNEVWRERELAKLKLQSIEELIVDEGCPDLYLEPKDL